MIEQRKEVRFQTRAHAKLEGADERKILVKDFSVTGCRIEYSDIGELELNTRYKLEIIPEDDAKIGVFTLLVESKWIRIQSLGYEVGFAIIESPKGEFFQRYVDYLDWLSSRHNTKIENLPKKPPL